jgi:hypothetical protein
MSNFIYTIKVLNSECENALIDFPFHEQSLTWIKDYQLLFNHCLITIASPSFEAIQKEDQTFINKLIEMYQAVTKNI